MPVRRSPARRHRARLAPLIAMILLCTIIGSAVGVMTVPSASYVNTPVPTYRPTTGASAPASHTPRFRMGGRVALTVTPPRPTAIPTRLAASYHGPLPTPRPTVQAAISRHLLLSPSGIKTAVANSFDKGM